MNFKLTAQLEELQLIKCSLLPGEDFSFSLPENEAVHWRSLLDAFAEGTLPTYSETEPESACRFRISVESAPIAFEIEFPRDYPSQDGSIQPVFSVRKAQDDQMLDREEQVRWQKVVKDKLAEIQKEYSEFMTQMLISEHLVPLLHAEATSQSASTPSSNSQRTSGSTNTPTPNPPRSPSNPPIYHALLTSHHLISPTKRRSLAKWSSDLHLRGFAKVGYPGVIYVESVSSSSSSSGIDGTGMERVEEFVRRVKGMQWLALRVRFVEELEVPVDGKGNRRDEEGRKLRLREGDEGNDVSWLELEKVGEVVEVMRRSGRERYVTEMGLGSSGAT